MKDYFRIGEEKDEELLTRALDCWNSLREFRIDRERCKRFTYGDQWDDMIEDKGIRMKEEEYIRRQGNMPLKNNLIRRLVRNVLGVFRNKWELPVCIARDPSEQSRAASVNCLLEYNQQLNRLEEIYARTMEEFLISGMAVNKKWYGRRCAKTDCWTDIVSPANFFFDTTCRDFRGGDISIIGEIHEVTPEEICSAFAKDSADVDFILRLTGCPANTTRPTADNRVLHRVTEIWEKKKVMKYLYHDFSSGQRFTVEINGRSHQKTENHPGLACRLIFEDEWHYTFLTEEGYVLARGKSPYNNSMHPYIFKAYPFIDGEIHSFVSDIIDQQKLTNRLISMYDWILRASAKGVLLFPEGSLPDGVDINDVAEEWSRFNGVIIYRPKPGVALPQQISSRATDIGITELLEIQMKMMEDISGVNGALQGKLDNGSMSGTLYNQQTQNSLTSLTDLLKSFDDFIHIATLADIENMRRFYPERKLKAIIGERTGFADSLKPEAIFFDTDCDFKLK